MTTYFAIVICLEGKIYNIDNNIVFTKYEKAAWGLKE